MVLTRQRNVLCSAHHTVHHHACCPHLGAEEAAPGVAVQLALHIQRLVAAQAALAVPAGVARKRPAREVIAILEAGCSPANDRPQDVPASLTS